MANVKLIDWDKTPANNVDIDGVGITGNSNRSGADNAFRNILGQTVTELRKAADIASASTCDIGGQAGHFVHVTGTTPISSFGVAPDGILRHVTFDGALTLTYNATSLVLPGNANITTVSGDTAIFVSEGSGNWRCLVYTRRDGSPVVAGFTSTDAGATAGPVLDLYRDSASPIANDLLGQVLFSGEDDSGAKQTYGAITGRLIDPTAGNEDGDLLLQSEVAGVLTTGITVRNGGILGTQTNDNAAAGNVGQTKSSSIVSGSAVALTTSLPSNITSLDVEAGDWLVWGAASFLAAASTSITIIIGAIGTTSATLPSTPGQIWADRFAAFVPGNVGIGGYSLGPIRVSVASTTTIYLIGQATFTASTLGGYGVLYAQRIR